MLDEVARGLYFTVTSPGAEAKQSNDVLKLIQSLAIICFVVLSNPAFPCTALEICFSHSLTICFSHSLRMCLAKGGKSKHHYVKWLDISTIF